MQQLVRDYLLKNPKYCYQKELTINTLVEDIKNLNPELIAYLQAHTDINEAFFPMVNGTILFLQDNLIKVIRDLRITSYGSTEYLNSIGLIDGDNRSTLLSSSGDIVLNFPYKDCVLEGGMTKEEIATTNAQGKKERLKEILLNEVVASKEVKQLLSPKVLQDFKVHNKDGIRDAQPKDLTGQENLLINGNNLLALHSLKEKYIGKVKLIYIDPPYNRKQDTNTFRYNNHFINSSWLVFMKNRLEVSKELLKKEDGALICAIDDEMFPYLGVLLREIFKEESYEHNYVTITHNPRGVQGKNFSRKHEYAIFITPKDKKIVVDRNIDIHNIDWRSLRDNGGESLRTDAKNCFYPILVKEGEVIGFGDVVEDLEQHPPNNEEINGVIYIYPIDKQGIERKWRYARQSVETVKHLLRADKQKSGGYDIKIGKDFGLYSTVWVDTRYDANEYGTKLLKEFVPDSSFSFPKSLWTVFDSIFSIVKEDKEAIILDFFGGSGTTAHSVLEINKIDGGNRKFILCEQMEKSFYQEIIPRITNTISKYNLNEKFITCSLAKYNQVWKENIQKAHTKEELQTLYQEMKKKSIIQYRIAKKNLYNELTDKSFFAKELDAQKTILIEVLDKNFLYIPLSHLEDELFGEKISAPHIELNKTFYSE